MSSGILQRPTIKTLLASAAHTTTEASTSFAMPVGVDTYHLILSYTAVSGTSPTCDAILQTSVDKGTTFVNIPIRGTQVTTTGLTHFVFKMGLGGNEVALESPAAATGGTLAKNCVFDPEHMKILFTLGGTSPSFTLTVYGLFTPRGSRGEY